MTESISEGGRPPTILSFSKDLPNLCSLAGLLCAVLAIYFAIIGNFPAAMIGLVWAVFLDWSDGNIARKLKNRTDAQKSFGGQLDSLVDIVSFGVCPAVVLLSYGNYGIGFVPGAFIIVAAGVLRLSYFNVFGLIGESTYQGLAIDNNGILLVLLFFIEGFISVSLFTVVLYASIVLLAVLNVAPIRTPKLSARGWYYAIATYAVAASLFYIWRLMQTAS